MGRSYISAFAGMTMFMVAACAPSAPPAVEAEARPDACGTLAKARFDEPGLPARDYYVYVPCGLKQKEQPPLVVYLHGCNQNATEAAVQTRWSTFADAHHLILAYPQQFDPNTEPFGPQQLEDHALDGNGARCWNWFRPEHNSRGSGEPATIAGITQAIMNAHNVDPARVYVAGISAGGVMTSVMGATYPELYAALGVIAGCGYPACADPSGTLAAQAMGANAHEMPVLVVHGTADEAAAFPMGLDAVHQWLDTNDLLDDGAANGSVPAQPASSEDHGLDASALDGLGTVGDTCVGNRTASPCLGGVLGFGEYPYTIQHYLNASGQPLLDFWIIHGGTHNYVSGDPSVNWSDPLGPDITQAAYDFFMAHPRQAR